MILQFFYPSYGLSFLHTMYVVPQNSVEGGVTPAQVVRFMSEPVEHENSDPVYMDL